MSTPRIVLPKQSRATVIIAASILVLTIVIGIIFFATRSKKRRVVVIPPPVQVPPVQVPPVPPVQVPPPQVPPSQVPPYHLEVKRSDANQWSAPACFIGVTQFNNFVLEDYWTTLGDGSGWRIFFGDYTAAVNTPFSSWEVVPAIGIRNWEGTPSALEYRNGQLYNLGVIKDEVQYKAGQDNFLLRVRSGPCPVFHP